MDLVTAEILIAGDMQNTVVRHQFRPLTIAEVGVLRMIHGGPESVRDVKYLKTVDRSTTAEKARLVGIYGSKKVELCYPGLKGSSMETEADDHPTEVAEDQLTPQQKAANTRAATKAAKEAEEAKDD